MGDMCTSKINTLHARGNCTSASSSAVRGGGTSSAWLVNDDQGRDVYIFLVSAYAPVGVADNSIWEDYLL